MRSPRAAVELLVTLVAVVFFVVVIQAFAVKPYRIPSGSMEPTLHIGDRLLVDRFSERVLGNDPPIGAIVVFHPPAGADDMPAACGDRTHGSGTSSPCDRPTAERSSQTFVKRIVAVGGDTIAIRDGHVIRNGHLEADGYTAPCGDGSGCDFPTPITVPRGSYFLMGDNRGNSEDSRYWGPVPRAWIIGQARATYWPPKRVGTL